MYRSESDDFVKSKVVPCFNIFWLTSIYQVCIYTKSSF